MSAYGEFYFVILQRVYGSLLVFNIIVCTDRLLDTLSCISRLALYKANILIKDIRIGYI